MVSPQLLILLVGGFFSGVINSVAGGGSFILYPLLLALGVPPVNANASCSLIVLPGQGSSAYGYKSYLKKTPHKYYLLLIPSILGGLAGALLLGRTPNHIFEYIVPWFVLIAALLLILQPRLHQWLYQKENKKLVRKHKLAVMFIVGIALFFVSIYGGYFGAGYGIMMLAFLGLTELTNIHQMNGLKNITGVIMSGAAAIYFILTGLISWKFVPLLLIGNGIGGFVGARYSSHLSNKFIRGIIIGIALTIAFILFAKVYLP